MGRLRFCLALGVVVAAGETVAGLAIGNLELGYFLLQAALGFALGAALFLVPLPQRVLALLPVAVGGGFHIVVSLYEWRHLPAAAWGLAIVHVLVIAPVLYFSVGPRLDTAGWSRRALATAGASYLALALWCGRFLVPLALSPQAERMVAGALCATLVPALAALGMRAVFSARPRMRVGAIAALAGAVLVPVLLHWPVLWSLHRQLPPSAEGGEGPNVFLIVLDTARADRMSVYDYGRPTTPHLEEFAREATVYTAASSQGVWTLPGHASLFTGLYSAEHGADFKVGVPPAKLPLETVTLAERFRIGGYSTACVAANNSMFSRDFGLTQGFEVVWTERGRGSRLPLPFVSAHLVHSLFGQRHEQDLGPLGQHHLMRAREVNRTALDWLDRSAGGPPRFVFLNFMEAHGMVRREPCAGAVFGDGRSHREWEVPNYDAVMYGDEEPDPVAARGLGDWYDNQLACLDQHLGELFDALEERGLYRDALIVVTADHGHMLGEHRSFEHWGELWEGLIHVPLMIKLPGQERGQVCDSPVETADLASTLPRLAGLAATRDVPSWAGAAQFLPPQPTRGLDGGICPLPGRGAAAVSQAAIKPDLAERNPERWNRSYVAFRDGSLKFLVDSTGRRLVADLAGDPAETLRPLTPAEEVRLDTLLQEWQAGLIEPVDTGGEDSAEEGRRRLEELQAVGYLGG